MTTYRQRSEEIEVIVSKPDVRVRRIYEEPASHYGTRVLVDRIWPRGLTKAKPDIFISAGDSQSSTARNSGG